jgi:hypothetical protein
LTDTDRTVVVEANLIPEQAALAASDRRGRHQRYSHDVVDPLSDAEY